VKFLNFVTMKIKGRIYSTTILLLLFSLQLQAQKKNDVGSITDHFVTVDGHKMHYRVAGLGSPTVVLESGLGDGVSPWAKVFTAVSKYTRVVAYDRSGLGQSEKSSGDKSFVQIAKDLHSMLANEEINGPYVLVGHSLGGALIRAFAFLYPEDVKGMVFIDPVSENSFDSLTDLQKQQMVARQDSGMTRAPDAIRREWKYLANETLNGSVALTSFGRLPSVPIALIVAGTDRPPLWIHNLLNWYKQKLSDRPEASLYLFPGYGHYVQTADPDMVTSAIQRIVFPNAEKVLLQILKQKGADSAALAYRQMRKRYPESFLSEDLLNKLGYQQLSDGNIKGAIVLFRLNVEMYPKEFNTYDSLAEAYAAAGDNKNATINYEKSVLLNPKNENAVEWLKKHKIK
jgi:pimeloyl-ACP methyl ester carboxylesterase